MDISNVSNGAAGARQAVPAQPDRRAPSVSSAPGALAPGASPPVTAQELQRAVDVINVQLQQSAKGLRFSVDEGTGKTIVRVVDVETEKVIRQIPSEEALAISRSIEKLQGLLLDQEI